MIPSALFSSRSSSHFPPSPLRALLLLLLAFSLSSAAQNSTAAGNTAVLSWGRNTVYQLGDGTGADKSLPTDISAQSAFTGKTVIQLAAGADQTLALCSDGTLVDWGASGNSPRPEQVQKVGIFANKTVVQIAAGVGHYLALCSDGTLLAWGINTHGQLGDGTTNRGYADITGKGALSGKTVTQIAAGFGHSLALCSDGSIVAWGYNEFSQLGDGTAEDRPLPVAFKDNGTLSGKTVVQLVAGYNHSFALCSDGTLIAWGYNCFGQLGVGEGIHEDNTPPTDISNNGVLEGKRVTQIVTGVYHGLALCSDGTVAAWGYNDHGQIGEDSGRHFVPISITNSGALHGKRVTRLVAGEFHNFAFCSDGAVAAWGWNERGELGDGTNNSQYVPVNIQGKGDLAGRQVTQIAAGYEHTVALATVPSDTQKPVITVKFPTAGQQLPLSSFNGDTIGGVATDESGVSAVSLKLYRSRGGVNQVWDGSSFTTTPATVPAQRSGSGPSIDWKMGSSAPPLSQLDAGNYSFIAYATDPQGNVGVARGSFTLLSGPPDTQPPLVSIGNPAADQKSFIAAFDGGTIRGTASDNVGVAKIQIKLFRTRSGVNEIWNGTAFTTKSVTVAAQQSSDGPSVTWRMGLNAPPQSALDEGVYSVIVYASDAAGNSSQTRCSFTLLAPDTQKPLVGICLLNNQKIAIDDLPFGVINGSSSDNVGIASIRLKLYRTRNGVNQVWNGTAFTPTPATVTPDTTAGPGNGLDWKLVTQAPPASQLDEGPYQLVAYATDTSGNSGSARVTFNFVQTSPVRVLDWGEGEHREPFDISRAAAIFGKTVSQIAVGGGHHGFLCTDGTVATGGSNTFGQLGDGTESGSYAVDITRSGVLNGKRVIQLKLGEGHSLALCSDGTVAAWGNNNSGQLGDGTTTNRLLPVVIQGGALSGKTVTQIVAGGDHSLALCSDGSLVAWGGNTFGQLGNGSTTRSRLPILISERGALRGKTVAQVAAGGAYTLALCSDGSLVAWGDNSQGQLGDGTQVSHLFPVTVAAQGALRGKTIAHLAAGYQHVLALCGDGSVVAWGGNGSGQLGDGTTTTRVFPLSVTGHGNLRENTVTQIGAGFMHSAALCSDGKILMWGANSYGQLGLGSEFYDGRSVPTDITGRGALRINTITQIAVGGSYNLALATPKEAPSIAILTPKPNEILKLTAFNGDTITGDALDNKSVTGVSVKLYRTRGGVNQIWNGTSFTATSTTVPTDFGTPYPSVRWRFSTKAPPVSQLDAGEYQVIAYATDADGHTAAARTTFTLIPPDSVKPTVRIDTPLSGRTISISDFASGVSPISGRASDDIGVKWVFVSLTRQRGSETQYWDGRQFSLSPYSQVMATLSGPPTKLSWKFDQELPTADVLDEGIYNIYAFAYDTSDNYRAAPGVSITLSASSIKDAESKPTDSSGANAVGSANAF